MPSRRELANAIRILAVDAVQKANSGHPGMPMGMADIAEVLWNDFLKHNPSNPHWLNRDRFILSNGHGSMLQYALLHLSGYDLPMSEIRNFRQLYSQTPGHPEFKVTPGVETTTGPLGQGLANGVGMAIAERALAGEFNRENHNIIDHYTYVFAGDGCMMEGVSHEVGSLAGTLGLGKLIVFYDDNGISIDGETEAWFGEDTAKRFEAYGWHVNPKIDGQDAGGVRAAIEEARAEENKPSLLCCQTTIGFGAPNKAGSADTHGSPLGEEEVEAVRAALAWQYPPFEIPNDIYDAYDATKRGATVEKDWKARFDAYSQVYPRLARELLRRTRGQLPKDFSNKTNTFVLRLEKNAKDLATRKSSQQCLKESLLPEMPELIGGSCDLGGSNGVLWKGLSIFSKDNPKGRYIHYGVREFGMFAINNGIALHGGFIPYGATFLTFTDYGRNAMRLAAMMRKRNIFVLTHDSIGLGEDGPTHQPIEHISILRSTPNIDVWRPADGVETAIAWQSAVSKNNGPTALLLTRQTVPFIAREREVTENIARGGYVVSDSAEEPQAIIIATGSELHLALQAQGRLMQKGYQVRVVSMPCCEVFDAQPKDYQNIVLTPHITARIAVEAGSTAIWYRYVGLKGKVVGIDRFGESAPYQEVYRELGITVDNIVLAVIDAIKTPVSEERQ